jgi:hypothetical protein
MGFTSRCLNSSRPQALIKLWYLGSGQNGLRKDILNQKYSKYVYEIGFLILLNGVRCLGIFVL